MSGTRWVRLDVDYCRNPKVLRAGRDGRDLHLASICWSGGQDLDGVLPFEVVPMLLADAGVAKRAIGAAVLAGLWIPHTDGYTLHDFPTLNGTESEAEVQRVKWRGRQADYRARRKAAETNGATHA